MKKNLETETLDQDLLIEVEEIKSGMTFLDLGLNENILQGVEDAGFQTPTSIQEEIIPSILNGKNVIGKAQTGSGKTASFALPTLNNLIFNQGVEVLVLVPTRELSQQVVDSYKLLGKFVKKFKVTNIVGGESHSKQIRAVADGAQVVVATPGRLLDLLSSKRFNKFNPHTLILDEADEMMDMGFIDDIKEIMGYLEGLKQTALFSATMPLPILRLTQEFVPDAIMVKGKDSEEQNANIERDLYIVSPKEREDALIRIIEKEKPSKAIVFCRTRQETDDLCQSLNKQGILSRAIHGDLNQNSRIQVMNQIKEGRLKIMVATDVASRGIDISDLSHVFNFHTPENKERFTHRIGRTGRAGNKGKAITISTPMELKKHTFFRQYPLNRFNLLSVPTLSELKLDAANVIVEQLAATHISRQAEKLLPMITEGNDSNDIIQKLLTLLIANSQSIEGPQNIGYTPEAVLSMLKEKRSTSSSRRGGSSSSSYGKRGERTERSGAVSGGSRRPRGERPRRTEQQGEERTPRTRRPDQNDGNSERRDFKPSRRSSPKPEKSGEPRSVKKTGQPRKRKEVRD